MPLLLQVLSDNSICEGCGMEAWVAGVVEAPGSGPEVQSRRSSELAGQLAVATTAGMEVEPGPLGVPDQCTVTGIGLGNESPIVPLRAGRSRMVVATAACTAPASALAAHPIASPATRSTCSSWK